MKPKMAFAASCLIVLLSFITSTRLVAEASSCDGATDMDLINCFVQSKSNSSDSGDKAPSSGSVSGGSENRMEDKSSHPRECQCVPYYKCKTVAPPSSQPSSGNASATPTPPMVSGNLTTTGHNGSESDDSPSPLFDVRLDPGNKSSDGNKDALGNAKSKTCAHYWEVCCNEIKPETPDIANKTVSGTPKVNMSSWEHTKCGLRNEKGIGLHVTDPVHGESQFAEFPWTVAVIQEENIEGKGVKNVFLGGGSLIHPKVVMTAAHVVFNVAVTSKNKFLKVRVGEWDTQNAEEPLPHQDRRIEKIIIHPELYRKGLFNDVALLFLQSEVKLAPNVDTICLPPPSTNVDSFNGQMCFSSGWGKDSFESTAKNQKIMKKVQVPVVPRSDCQSKLRKTRLGESFMLHESFICAGGSEEYDTCTGDGGSPLACKLTNSPSYVQVGIVDWGIGCKNSNPGVYVTVLKFLPWIKQNMDQNGMNMKYSTVS